MSKWIRVDEQLPEAVYGEFLVYCEGGNIAVSLYFNDRKQAMRFYSNPKGNNCYSRKRQGKFSAHFAVAWKGYKITHWMPLPESPEESNNG